jgi:hypothetical protein
MRPCLIAAFEATRVASREVPVPIDSPDRRPFAKSCD